jgi:chaperonin cofactor prefoldin
MAKKKAVGKPVKASAEEQLSRYHDVFDEVQRFVDTIRDSESELKDADTAVAEAKRVYDEAKDHAAKVRDMLTGAKHGLFRYLAPIDGGKE